MIEREPCGWTDPLPKVGEKLHCHVCGLDKTYGGFRRCSINGRAVESSAVATAPQQSARCVHLGEEVHQEPCSCGNAVTVAIHACNHADGPKRCCPGGHARIADHDVRSVITNCRKCPLRSTARRAETRTAANEAPGSPSSR